MSQERQDLARLPRTLSVDVVGRHGLVDGHAEEVGRGPVETDGVVEDAEGRREARASRIDAGWRYPREQSESGE